MTTARIRRSPIIVLLTAVVVVGGVLLWRPVVGHAASSLPADKMTATAGDNTVQGPNTTVAVMQAQMKTSNPADLIFQVTSECTILSQITNMGNNQTSNYVATVKLWISLDGNPVPVVPPVSTTGASGSGTASPDDGKVVFCNREFTRSTMFDTANESIQDIESTEQANAFNWVAMNVGAGVHTIVVKADFVDTNGADTFAHGVISKRSLTINTTNYLISQQP